MNPQGDLSLLVVKVGHHLIHDDWRICPTIGGGIALDQVGDRVAIAVGSQQDEEAIILLAVGLN